MWRFLSSLTFLYAFTVLLIVLFAIWQYRDFRAGRYRPLRFRAIFGIIAILCLGFLGLHLHAPLSLRTYTNLDHQFLRHDGFYVNKELLLGAADTANYRSAAFSRFAISRADAGVQIKSDYSEEPAYYASGGDYELLSPKFPAKGASLSFSAHGVSVSVKVIADDRFQLQIDGQQFEKQMTIKKGIQVWTLFRDHPDFILHPRINDPFLTGALEQVYLVRDRMNRKSYGELSFFISGRAFRYASAIRYNDTGLDVQKLRFQQPVAYGGHFAWGIAFLDNNRNQYRFQQKGTDSLLVLERYPTAYPLTGEERNDWTPHAVSKFLLGSARQMDQLSPGVDEGFLFPAPGAREEATFPAVLLQYRQGAGDEPVSMQARWLHEPGRSWDVKNGQLALPAASAGFVWLFSVNNSFRWDFNGWALQPGQWKLLIFGSLLFFALLVFLHSLVQTPGQHSTVAQVLAMIVMLLLTTRFFLYWRYKSFPPYEGMDLPSQQQLASFANFGIIVFASIVLALLFGHGIWKWIIRQTALGRRILQSPPGIGQRLVHDYREKMAAFTRRFAGPGWFLLLWLLLLAGMSAIAALSGFNTSTCRHIAITLLLFYFLFLYISYRHSPLVVEQSKAWWQLATGRRLEMLVNNPVKILLSVSLLAVFLFVDIGFAIVFLNFLLFNEAFLCINYGIAGLSTGSRYNARWMALLGAAYLLLFILNLFFAPYIFQFLLQMSTVWYMAGYAVFALMIAYVLARLSFPFSRGQRRQIIAGSGLLIFCLAFLFFPKERILDKASVTRYRIDVLTKPVNEAIAHAYAEGKNYTPVIRAAQNQWFINTFVEEANNPAASQSGFTLLPHAPQNKGARYNAQATDLVASRFLMGEHGRYSILLYVCLLLLPVAVLASFYKLYPDFTSRINATYPPVSVGFSVLNYLLITSLMVVLAATGRYIFFGQDLPFGSILSKQSILFPLILLAGVVLLFRSVPAERYAHRRKWMPGVSVFLLLVLLLVFVRPTYNRNREFTVDDMAGEMDQYVQAYLQPILDYIDTSKASRRAPLAEKDRLFSDSLRKWLDANKGAASNLFFEQEARAYASSGFARHRDQRRLLFLDPGSAGPRITVNQQYFRVEPPPHLQVLWRGDVVGDTAIVNLSVSKNLEPEGLPLRLVPDETPNGEKQSAEWKLSWIQEGRGFGIRLQNTGSRLLHWKSGARQGTVAAGNNIRLSNNSTWECWFPGDPNHWWISLQPDAYMRNYFVNGSRYYHYPLKSDFIWARNFAEAVSVDYAARGQYDRPAIISVDYEWMDSLTHLISEMLAGSTEYPDGAAYGIAIADDRGRIRAMADQIKGFRRVDPNDKASFSKLLLNEEGRMLPSEWRRQLGNLNLLRLNPGPGSSLKPIVFSAIASQLALDWNQFGSTGFTEKQTLFGGMRVPEYDFELNNGAVHTVADYLRLSDNYYHANVLLLGSYRKQPLGRLLQEKFGPRPAGTGLHWPYLQYRGQTLYMNGFSNWPGFANGRADFGDDSSFTSIGLWSNYGVSIDPQRTTPSFFSSAYDSLLLGNAARQSGFVLPEWSLFDQKGWQLDHRIPYDIFLHCFRGHVKGSSQVLMSPMGMVHAFGRLSSQNRNYHLTLDPAGAVAGFSPFIVDQDIRYNDYLELMRTQVFRGMKDVMERGTGAVLGRNLRQGGPYYYFGKTGTTGDDKLKTKSKLFALVISEKDMSSPNHVFRDNKFIIIYFTSQNGPPRQNEEFQARVVKYLESSSSFRRYMGKW